MARRRALIGVCGGSASGKTTLAHAVAEGLAPAKTLVISEDDYYFDHGSTPGFNPLRYNFDALGAHDHDLLIEHLTQLRAGEGVEAPMYNFNIHRRAKETNPIAPHDAYVVEGIHLFAHRELCELFDLKVYVDAPSDIRLARRLLRDMNERGRTAQSVIAQYLKTVRPMHLQYTEAFKDRADIVIENGNAAAEEAEKLVNVFEGLAHDVITRLRTMIASHPIDPESGANDAQEPADDAVPEDLDGDDTAQTDAEPKA